MTSTRPTGATASMPRGQMPVVTSATGAGLDISKHVSAPGFNPLDLLYASLAACIALSARMAAQTLGVLDRMDDVRVTVTGEKAANAPSRVERLVVAIEIDGTLDADMKQQIAHAAESEICTVSNTLRGGPTIKATLAP